MDRLLLSYLQASDESERQQHLDDLLLVHAAPVVRQALRRRLGFYVNQRGINPHNQDAEDLYQEIMTKIVQALHDLRNPPAKTVIENLKQYVARIASNACNDVLRTKSPARARLKNNLRFVLSHHRDFAVWKTEGETLSGFGVWQDSSKSLSSERQLVDIEERLASFRSTRFPRENIKQAPLTKIVAELFRWMGGPVELDVLVNIVATLLDVKDLPVESVDDATHAYLEARLADSTLSSSSRLEEQVLLRSLWQALKEFATEQRDVFCFGFEDGNGRDLFTVLLEAEIVNLRELAQELGRSPETIVGLWSKMPMDDKAIALELKTTRAQVYKWRFRALGRLKKGLLPFSGEK
jgi:RNA polymerase sigma factor (sigma-70 family)